MDPATDWIVNQDGRYRGRMALDFDGVDDNLDIGNSTDFQNSNGSVFAWIKTAAAGSSYRAIIAKTNAYGMFLVDNVFGLHDWTTGIFRTTSVNLADSTWHHVGATFRSGVTNGTELYIDGNSRLTTTMTIVNQSSNLRIALNSGSQYFTGLIDDCLVYNRILAPCEVTLLASRRAIAYEWEFESIPQTAAAGTFQSAWARYSNVLMQPGMTV